jgi:DNA-binding transcriptional regulator LsrR (DeoR family)
LTGLGNVAADYLLQHIKDGDVIGIGGGTAVNSVAQSIDPQRQYEISVVPILGAVQGQITTDVNYLADQLGKRLGGRVYQLHAPAFVDTQEHCQTILSISPVKEIIEIASKATIALFGIGTVDPDISRFVQFTALSTEDMKRIAKNCGAVGEISAVVYDINGKACASEYNNRVVGLDLDRIHQIPFRIGVAASAAKAAAIYGALRGQHIHTLITDEAAAKGILELVEEHQQEMSYT